MSLVVGVFVFGCFVTISVGFGLMFAASALEVGSSETFEGKGLENGEQSRV